MAKWQCILLYRFGNRKKEKEERIKLENKEIEMGQKGFSKWLWNFSLEFEALKVALSNYFFLGTNFYYFFTSTTFFTPVLWLYI